MSDRPSELDQAVRSGKSAPRVTSVELLRGGRELVIEHGTDEYRLRLTGRHKLILTK